MPKNAITGWLHGPLAAIMGTQAKIAVLRILWRTNVPVPFREVVRRSGMAYGSINLALDDLLEIGLVEEVDGGRERRIFLRTSHRLAPTLMQLLQADGDFYSAFRAELRAVFRHADLKSVLSAVLVGSVARREERIGDRVDLVVIGSDAASIEPIRTRIEQGAASMRKTFGVALHVIAYDVDTARAMWRTRTAAAERDVDSAELIAGAPLVQILGG